MPVPLDAYRSLLLEETLAIGTQQREIDFAGYTAVEPPNHQDEEQVYYVSFTNAHMVPGDSAPRLRQAQLHNPEVPTDVAEDVVERVAEQLETPLPHLHEDNMRGIAEATVAACEELDEQESPLLRPPFKTLAVMAISITMDGHPLIFQHSSRDFAASMARHTPDRWRIDASQIEEVSDDVYRTAYMQEAEHKDMPPFEEWKNIVIESGAEVLEKGEDLLTKQCEANMGFFLSREEAMRPAIAKLFKE